jgi:hypothetical protein
MTIERPITRVLAPGSARGAIETLRQISARPRLGRDLIVARSALWVRATRTRSLICGSPPRLTPAEKGIVAELMHPSSPHLAAHEERPAVYLLRNRGGPEWLEL